MNKSYINKITHKDGNKLGRRKREHMIGKILKEALKELNNENRRNIS